MYLFICSIYKVYAVIFTIRSNTSNTLLYHPIGKERGEVKNNLNN